MRIPSGKTDQVIYFVAVDVTDLKTRETGLSSFTVYRSRNGGAATIYTTPTVAELSAANAPGVYSLLIDEDTTVGASSDSEEYVVHITQASMAPVTRVIELYRREVTSGQTLTVTAGLASANATQWNGLTTVALPLVPTVAGRTLAVDASNRALADVDTIKTNPVVNAGTVTFPTTATLASTTNITAGTIATVTNLTNLPSIPANWLTAAGIAAAALNGKGDWNIGKTGYSLTQTFPANFSALAITVGGAVTAGTVSDKTGYALTQTFPTNFSALSITAGGLADITQGAADKVWGTAARVLTAGTNIALAKGTGVTGFNDLDAAGVAAATWNAATVTYGTAGSYGLLVETNLDAAVSTRMATYTQPTGFLAAVFPGTVASPTNITSAAGITLAGVPNVNVTQVTGLTIAGIGTGANPWRPA